MNMGYLLGILETPSPQTSLGIIEEICVWYLTHILTYVHNIYYISHIYYQPRRTETKKSGNRASEFLLVPISKSDHLGSQAGI